jgi:hypothetical protein
MTSTLYAGSAPPIKNGAFTFVAALFSQADTKKVKTSPTLAAGDIKVSVNLGANWSNIATLPTSTTTGNLIVALTAAEMNANLIIVAFVDAAGAEWCDLTVSIPTVQAVTVTTPGPGSTSWPITITVGGLPKDGVDVWVSTDAPGSNVIARGSTNSSGVVTFMLDAGTYYAWKQLAGYTFTNPESFVVT